MAHSFEEYKNGYQQLFDTCVISSTKKAEIEGLVSKIVKNKARYVAVTQNTNVPWVFTGIIHCMESGLNFNTHLHNGDPLSARTTHVPAGRPASGTPPFTWEASAADALTFVGLTSWTDWSVAGMLYRFEKYNGFGYRSRGINSPYLWSYSNHYKKGKFTGDGKFDPAAVSKQCGAVVLLKSIIENDAEVDMPAEIKKLGAEVIYDPGHVHANAEQLQLLLNSAGKSLVVDGKAGRKTSDAYFSISGKFLQGDPKII
ncbi:MAG: hypothetical protein HOP10_09175 [Chitinophagaceae bacterium]|nr:hypothetical protein [Chitinophagaceae bacterium]